MLSSRQRARNITLRKDAHAPAQTAPLHPAPNASWRARLALRFKYLRDYAGWLRPHARRLMLLFLLALLAAGLDLLWPLLIKAMVDRLSAATLTSAEKLRYLLLFSFGVLALLLIKQPLELYRAYSTAVLNAKLLFRLRRRLFGTLLHLPLARLADLKSGGIVSRLGSDVDQVGSLVQQALIAPAIAVLRILLTVGVLLYLSPSLALATLTILPPVAVLTLVWLRKVRPVYRSMMENRSDLDARVAETFGGIRVVRAFRREPREALDYALGSHTVIRKMLRANRTEFALENAWGLLIPLASLLVVAYGGYLVLSGAGQLGDVFAFQIYAVLLLGPVVQIVSSVSQTQKSLAAMERVFDTLREPPDKPDPPTARPADPHFHTLTLDRVCFTYPSSPSPTTPSPTTANTPPNRPVLSDISLTVPAGSTVALVGPSGAGKTTLTDLVCRFHDPTSGAIRLNDTDLRDIRLATYRSLLAVVQQETFLFDGTVAENIAYARRRASLDDIADAARQANAHEFITALPQGYATTVGERGFKLSGGQRQRLSIARAILADPRILILDEATSALDTESEQLIQQALRTLLKGRTTFVIAHRLSTIQNADLIVVLNHGRVVEQGTHDQLLAARGFYFDMVERQRLAMESHVPR